MQAAKSIPTRLGAVTIRQAQAQDAAQVRELRLEALLNAPEAFGSDYQQNLQRTTEWWAEKIRLAAQSEQEVLYLAQVGGELVGMTGLFRGGSSRNRHGGVIYTVYVRPAWRGLRLAEALVRACLEWGAAHKVTVARLAVITTNLPAIRCYLRCGFSVYGVEPMATIWEGQYQDELLMVRRLEGESGEPGLPQS
jgi:RimJ/RimL family protein N-acetyltransferase